MGRASRVGGGAGGWGASRGKRGGGAHRGGACGRRKGDWRRRERIEGRREETRTARRRWGGGADLEGCGEEPGSGHWIRAQEEGFS